MMTETQAVSLLRDELINLFSGAFFVFVGMVAFAIAIIRRRGGVRILVWIGLWSSIFGLAMLFPSDTIRAALPVAARPFLTAGAVFASYLTLVAAALAFLELTQGAFRRFLLLLVVIDAVIAVAGIGAYIVSGNARTFLVPNQIMAIIGCVCLLVVLFVPSFTHRCLVLPRSRVLTIGTLLFAAEGLWTNVAAPLDIRIPSIVNSLGFAVLLFAFGYVALDMILRNERRLLAIDRELQIARQLQFSLLPEDVPKRSDLRIAAVYEPMTAVAGDFYEFLPIDEHHIGFFIVDVAGHGVPAALIASMVKIAAHSVNGCANDPSSFLRALGNTLSCNLRGQLVSAAYLWIDLASRIARYSAAGHPPLLRWCAAEGTLERIENNGLLLGFGMECKYPVCELKLSPGDRFLLYTDGITEAENAVGEAFGDGKLEQVIRAHQSASPREFTHHLVSELRAWQPPSNAQQDDITLIVVDVQ